MERVIAAIMDQLDKLTITGKDAERMAAIKSMVRDLRSVLVKEDAEEVQNK